MKRYTQTDIHTVCVSVCTCSQLSGSKFEIQGEGPFFTLILRECPHVHTDSYLSCCFERDFRGSLASGEKVNNRTQDTCCGSSLLSGRMSVIVRMCVCLYVATYVHDSYGVYSKIIPILTFV